MLYKTLWLKCFIHSALRPESRKAYPCHLTVRFNCTVVCRRRAFVFSAPARAAGALSFLGDQERKQRSRRECDSPLPAPVGSGNRTFPGQQSPPLFRYQYKKPEVFLNLRLRINFRVSGQAGATPGEGLQLAKLVGPPLAPA